MTPVAFIQAGLGQRRTPSGCPIFSLACCCLVEAKLERVSPYYAEKQSLQPSSVPISEINSWSSLVIKHFGSLM